jgi:hypothetical protein
MSGFTTVSCDCQFVLCICNFINVGIASLAKYERFLACGFVYPIFVV